MSLDLLLTLVVIIVALVIFGLLITSAVFIVRDTIRQHGRWGINLQPTSCSRCGEPLPPVRRPTSFRQAIWGGWTCGRCGLELDKWGRPANGVPIPPGASDRFDRPIPAQPNATKPAQPDIQTPQTGTRPSNSKG